MLSQRHTPVRGGCFKSKGILQSEGQWGVLKSKCMLQSSSRSGIVKHSSQSGMLLKYSNQRGVLKSKAYSIRGGCLSQRAYSSQRVSGDA